MPKIIVNSNLSKMFAERQQILESNWEYMLEVTLLHLTEKIATEMKKRNITKSVLADKLGVSRSYITQVLRGKPNLQLDTLYKISFAVGLKPKIRFETTEKSWLNIFQKNWFKWSWANVDTELYNKDLWLTTKQFTCPQIKIISHRKIEDYVQI